MDKTIAISRARRLFNHIDSMLEEHEVIYITRGEKRVFAIVSIEYLESLAVTLECLSDPTFLHAIKESEKDIRDGRVFPLEDVIKEFLEETDTK